MYCIEWQQLNVCSMHKHIPCLLAAQLNLDFVHCTYANYVQYNVPSLCNVHAFLSFYLLLPPSSSAHIFVSFRRCFFLCVYPSPLRFAIIITSSSSSSSLLPLFFFLYSSFTHGICCSHCDCQPVWLNATLVTGVDASFVVAAAVVKQKRVGQSHRKSFRSFAFTLLVGDRYAIVSLGSCSKVTSYVYIPF